MKNLLMMLMVAFAVVLSADARLKYAADVSTPEKRAALIEKLWAHETSTDAVIWPTNVLPPNAQEKPYEFTTNELYDSNLVIGSVIRPQFSFFPAPGEGVKPAAVIYPGGGYAVLGWNKEGTEVARWLNSIGFSAFVLLYRTDNRDGALEDAQRTMGILRRDAAKYSIDPKRLGVIGFSAGANLAVRLATNWRTRAYPRVDEADDLPCRPDFMIPVYPWDLRVRRLENDPWGGAAKGLNLGKDYPVDAETPPCFVVQTLDDFCRPETAQTLELAMTRRGADCTAKYYSKGGHGYGIRRLGQPCDVWTFEATSWLMRFANPL